METEPNLELDVPMTVPYRIPDIFDGWRWKTSRNPHYEEAKAESLAWFRSFEDFYKENEDSIEGCDGSKSAYEYTLSLMMLKHLALD